jgi:multiple sugar transport system ATP-binding protein
MVFETSTLISFLDLEGNIGFGLRMHKVPKDERQDRVASEAGRLRLGGLLKRKPASLSAGESGRAHIGHALVRRPAAWLLDEPLAHLDPAERFELRRRLVREAKQQNVPTLYVTHDPAEALAVGDRVAVLEDGQLVQVDTPRDLYERPANAFVATFVAAEPLGLLLARVIRSGGLAGFQVGDRTLPFWSGLPGELEAHVSRAVVLAFRAEDVRDAADVDDPDVTRLHGIVVATEFTGPSVLATVQIEAPAPSCPGLDPPLPPTDQARLVARLPREHPVQLATDLTLAVHAARAHVFDATTGGALWHPADLVERTSQAQDPGTGREREDDHLSQ